MGSPRSSEEHRPPTPLRATTLRTERVP